MQTQYKTNTNPIQTQYRADTVLELKSFRKVQGFTAIILVEHCHGLRRKARFCVHVQDQPQCQVMPDLGSTLNMSDRRFLCVGRNASPDRSGQLLRLNENSQNVEAWNFISAAEPGAQAWLLSPRREKYRAGTIPNSNLLRVGVERIILWQ